MKLNDNLIQKILEYLYCTDYYIEINNVIFINKYFNDIMNKYNHIIKAYYYYKIKFKTILNDIPDFIIKNIDSDFTKNLTSFKFLLNSKNININNRVGITDYIDFLNIDDFTDTNIVYGRDDFNRFFISLLYKDLLLDSKVKIITFFQRYSNEKYFYVNCKKTFFNNITTHDFSKSNIKDQQFIILFDLLKNGISSFDLNSCFKLV